jgi:hypothetical protein
VDQGSNAFLPRGVLPHKLGGLGQIFRQRLPIVTAPNGRGGNMTGLGNLNVFDLFPLPWKRARMELGAARKDRVIGEKIALSPTTHA